MGGTLLDVWLEELLGRGGEPPDEGLSRVFGISLVQAQKLLARLPRVVKRAVAPEEARTLCDALRAIGGRVRLEKAQVAGGAGMSCRPGTPSASVRPTAARVSIPAAHLALPDMERPLEPKHPLELRPPATGGVQEWSALGLDAGTTCLSAPLLTRHDALSLPATDRPPARPLTIRPPTARKADPVGRAAAAAPTPGVARGSGWSSPLQVLAEILREAERSSWRAALQGHPVAGFVLVLGSTTGAAMLLYSLAT